MHTRGNGAGVAAAMTTIHCKLINIVESVGSWGI